MEFHEARRHTNYDDKKIRNTQIHQEIVCLRSHVSVPQNDQYYDCVPDDTTDEDEDVQDRTYRYNVDGRLWNDSGYVQTNRLRKG